MQEKLALSDDILMKIEKQKEEVYVIQKPRLLSDLSWKIAHLPVLSSDCYVCPFPHG